MSVVTEELIELANYSDTDEAQTLLDAVEQGDDSDDALQLKAVALVDKLIELGVVETDDREALLNPEDSDVDGVDKIYDEAEAENNGDEWDIVATDDALVNDDDDVDTEDEWSIA